MRKPLVFISHIHEDQALANMLEAALRRVFGHRIGVFNTSNETSLRMGDPSTVRIMAALATCNLILIVATPESVDRPWINFESGAVWLRRMPVIACCARGMNHNALPTPLGDLIVADLTSTSSLRHLMNAVATKLDCTARRGIRYGAMAERFGAGAFHFDPEAVRVRKALTRGNALAWGIRADTVVRTCIFRRRPDPSAWIEDVVLMHGTVGLRREWSHKSMAVDTFLKPVGRATSAPGVIRRDPIVLLDAYSTRPLPTPPSDTSTEIVFPTTPHNRPATLYWSQFARLLGDRAEPYYNIDIVVRLPSQALVCEIIVPRGLSDAGSATVQVFGRRGDVAGTSKGETADLLPQRDTLEYGGALQNAPSVETAPEHLRAVRHVLSKRRWKPQMFDLYRARVAYPLLHSMVRLQVNASKIRAR